MDNCYDSIARLYAYWREVIAVDQHSSDAHQAFTAAGTSVWLARPQSAGRPGPRGWYLAVFNLRRKARTIRLPWRALSLTGSRYSKRDLWRRRNVGSATGLRVRLPAHGAALLRVRRSDTPVR